MVPWSTTTTPRPASDPAKVTVPGSAARTGWPDRAEQVDAAVAGAVGRVGRVEGADHLGLGLERPDADRVGGDARQREGDAEQESGQGSHADTFAAGADRCRLTAASLWTNRPVVEAVDDWRTATGVDYS